MLLPPLVEGRLVRRYKRFLADVTLLDGRQVTVSVPNTGALLSCAEPGQAVWLTPTGGATKYAYRWTLAKPRRALVCIDTAIPNKVVFEMARRQRIAELAGYREYLAEVPYGSHSRADLCCRVHEADMLRRCWVEVKSTTLVRDRVACFPDAVTARGLKHLQELQQAVAEGDRALQVFFVQRADCESFTPADDIDPQYGAELRRAVKAGVLVLAIRARITKREVGFDRLLPVKL